MVITEYVFGFENCSIYYFERQTPAYKIVKIF